MILTPRDWQAMAQREASELLGTPEGAAKLAEAKRYGALADVIEQQHRDIERLSGAVAAERERCKQAVRDTKDKSGVNEDGQRWLMRAGRGDFIAAIDAL